MKNFYDFLMIGALLSLLSVPIYGQLNCLESVEIQLPLFGSSVALEPSDVLLAPIPSGTTINLSEVDCDDVGQSLVAVAIAEIDGEEVTCTSSVSVVDNVPPVAIADQEVVFSIPQGAEYIEINPFVIDDGSYDQCGPITLTTEPQYLICSDIGNPLLVKLIVTDASGNVNEALSEVTVLIADYVPVACAEDFIVSINFDRLVSLGEIVTDGTTCAEKDLTLYDEMGNPLPSQLITTEYIGQNITATVSQEGDDSSCSTEITVTSLDCDPYVICDTECRSTPIGDCDSGHSDTDAVEWPCDIIIDAQYDDYEQVRPNNLTQFAGVDPLDTEPQLFADECYLQGMAYTDQVFFEDGGVRIERKWHVLEWWTLEIAEFDQTITFTSALNSILWNICDTEPNSSALGDCTTGHSQDDDVEWPDDVFARDHRISPDELVNISGVDFDDSRPVLVNNINEYVISSSDSTVLFNDQYALVERTWTITARLNQNIRAEYVQVINVSITALSDDLVSVTSHLGRPIPGVLINNVSTSDDNGVVEVQGEINSIVLEDDVMKGIDMVDAILIYDHILGKWQGNDFQLRAMDIGGNGIVSTLDLIELQKLLAGSNEVTEFDLGWHFEQQSGNNLSNFKADFLAYKLGDVDDSAPLSYSNLLLPKTELLIEDLLLNAGESYSIGIKASTEINARGGQIEFVYDPNLVNITGVYSDLFSSDVIWNADAGILKVMFSSEDMIEVAENEHLIYVTIVPLENSTLAKGFKIADQNTSFLVSSDYEREFVNDKIEGQITSNTHELPVAEMLKVFPNPTKDFITLELKDSRNLVIHIFDTYGRRVIEANEPRIHVGHLTPGVYYFSGSNTESILTGKFIVSK